jgi:hypothetical protein
MYLSCESTELWSVQSPLLLSLTPPLLPCYSTAFSIYHCVIHLLSACYVSYSNLSDLSERKKKKKTSTIPHQRDIPFQVLLNCPSLKAKQTEGAKNLSSHTEQNLSLLMSLLTSYCQVQWHLLICSLTCG